MGSWPELVAVASPLLHLSMYATSPRLVPVPVVTSAEGSAITMVLLVKVRNTRTAATMNR